MDRQSVFKRISKILIPIEIIFIITSVIISGVIFYSAFNKYGKTHQVDMMQFYQILLVILIIIALFSIAVSSFFIVRSDMKKKMLRTVIFSTFIFLGIILSILFQFTLYQIKYFPLVFFGSAIITMVCMIFALIPNGLRAKVKQYIKSIKNGA